MKPIAQLIMTAAVAISASVLAPAAMAQEAPDVLVKRVSADVIDSVKPTRTSRPATARRSSTWSTARSCPTSTPRR
jgi:hypothetical protein